MTLWADVQTLEPGAHVRLFEVDATAIGYMQLFFHGHNQSSSIWWKGVEYKPWPIKGEGFEQTSDQPPQPKLTVGNLDGSISSMCMFFSDMLGALVTVRETQAQYLDAVNFPNGNPGADPTQEFPANVWAIEQKSSESRVEVVFELKNPMDVGGQQLPGRQIVANVCTWVSIGGYRGPYCGYNGPPVADINDQSTDDPALDKCSGRGPAACKLRFGPQGQLPYGSFAAAGLMRT